MIQITHEAAKVKYIMVSFLFLLALLELSASFLLYLFKQLVALSSGALKKVRFDLAMDKEVVRYDKLLKVENEKL